MSHNVEVSGVEFRDLKVLEAAVNELAREEGIQATFHAGEAAQSRGWGGRESKVDAVVRLPSEAYDIGFTLKDGNYVPFFESGFRPRGFASDPTAKSVVEPKAGDRSSSFANYHNATNIGKLVQRYSLLMAERNAAQQGMLTRRVTDKGKGQMRLEVQTR
jgi:hypothetical protein